MSTLREEEMAIAEPLHAIAPEYAAQFNAATGAVWRYEGAARDDEGSARLSFTLTRDSGERVWIAADRWTKRVSASPLWVLMPDGTEHGRRAPISDFIRTEYVNGTRQDKPKMDAGVALDRFLADPKACARRFVKHVAEPLHDLWPEVQRQIAEASRGYAERDEMAARLAARFGGRAREPRNGSVYVGFDGDLPALEIGYGGRIAFSYPPSMTETEVAAFFAVRRAAKATAGK